MNYTSLETSLTPNRSFLDYINFIFGFGKKKNESKEETNKQEKAKGNGVTLVSPIKGDIIQLENLSDAAFSSGALGKGVGIMPSVGKVFSPVNGVVSTIFPTKHAIAILEDSGLEILIHIGIDTVNLGGKFFTSHISDGDKITKGQLLVEFDIEGIKEEGYSLETPMVITNADTYETIEILGKEQINEFEDLIIVK